MVDSVNNSGLGIPAGSRNTDSVKSTARVQGSANKSGGESGRAESGQGVVVNVSAEAARASETKQAVALTNLAAAGAEAPTTQELQSALNADTVAAALGNTVDIRV